MVKKIIDKVNSSVANFVERLKETNRKYIKDWESKGKNIATHKLSVGTDENGIHFIYPDVQEINGELIDFTRPIYRPFIGKDIAIERKDTVQIGKTDEDLKEAIDFTKNYKKLNIYPAFKYGGKQKQSQVKINLNNPLKTYYKKEVYVPSPIVQPSNEMIAFMEDFGDRYDKFNNTNKKEFIVNRIKNDNPIIGNLPITVDGLYNRDTDTISLQDYLDESTYAHELAHKLNDSYYINLPRSQEERELIRKAYDTINGELYPGQLDRERFSTNTGLRKTISERYGDILGEELNQKILGLNDRVLLDYYEKENGYINKKDYLKFINGINSAEDLFKYYNKDKNYNELTDFEKRQWETMFNEKTAIRGLEIDKDKINVLKQALIKIAQNNNINKDKNDISYAKLGINMKNNKLQVKNGIAQPLGDNYFLMRGPKHEQGGIDIGKNLEVEGGEIVKLNPKSIKVLSNAKIMGDMTPAEYALGGLQNGTFEDRFNKGFKYQEKFKDVNKLNDDGTKARIGTEQNLTESKDNTKVAIDDTKNKNIKDERLFDKIAQKFIKHETNRLGKEEFIKRLHDNLIPFGYGKTNNGNLIKDFTNVIKRTFNSIVRNKQEIEVEGQLPGLWDRKMLEDSGVMDIYGEYLGIPNKDRYFSNSYVENSKYKPTKSTNENVVYKTLNPLPEKLRNNIINEGMKLKIGESKQSPIQDAAFNTYTISRGKDEKGEYISFYDNWDLNPTRGTEGSSILEAISNGKDPFVAAGIANPLEFYDRIYINDINKKELGGQMKKQYKLGGNGNVPSTGKKIKADLGLEETIKKLGQSFLYPSITPAIVTADKPITTSVSETMSDYDQQFTIPTNNGIFGKVGSLESTFNKVYPSVKINVPKITIPVTTRTVSTPTQTKSFKSETTPKSTTTKSSSTYQPRLNLDFLNEVTNPNGSMTNLRTGQTYFKDINRVRRTPYSSLNLKTGQTEYAGFINPYGAEIQSAVYNNGPQGRQERTAKERLLNAGDWVNIGANALGAITNLVTGLTSPDIKYARMRDAIPVMAPKINSNVNTTAEENAIDEAYNTEVNAIDSNTSNSQVALNRLRNANARRASAKIKVRSAAENIRRDLINKGNILAGEYQKYNIGRQEQVDAYNRQAEAAEFNANKDKIGNAISGFVGDIMQGASTITNAIEQRNADRINTVLSYMGNPNVNVKGFSEGFSKIYEQIYGTQPSKYMLRKFNK